jgi:hypothetical protein
MEFLKTYVNNDTAYICNLFGKVKPKIDKWTFKICLEWINPIFEECYGMKIKHNGTKQKAATQLLIKHGYYTAIFNTDVKIPIM